MNYNSNYDDYDASPSTVSLWRWFLLGFLTLPVGFAVALYFWAGVPGVEKALTRFIQPDGLLWALLLGLLAVLWCRGDRGSFSLMLVAFVFYTVGANRLFVEKMAGTIESRYHVDTPFRHDEPFDQVILLGGGTEYAANGVAQLNKNGDRVAMAARLYHTGKAKRLICTGEAIEGLSDLTTPAPSEQTRRILVSLGVPESDIVLIGGRNTSEEMIEIKKLLGDDPGSIGLVTSSWHLPRAIRLAEAHDLRFVGLPADLIVTNDAFDPLDLIPSAGALEDLGIIVKEHVARLAGR